MPAAKLPGVVDGGTLRAVPFGDPLFGELDERPRVESYLRCFRTPFDAALQPTVIVRPASEPIPAADELTNFRNVIAASAVVKARADRCRPRHNNHGPLFSELFDFYPIHLRLTRPGLIIQTAAERGTDTAERFHGQGALTYVYPDNVDVKFDEQLLSALLALWKAKPHRRAAKARRRRLFRSLELACAAMRGGPVNFGSVTDRGVSLSLWVSAFETLAHPLTGDVGIGNVRTFVEAVPWHGKRVRLKRYAFDYRSAHRRTGVAFPAGWSRVSKPVRVYGRLYRARNLMLHGEELPPMGLEPEGRKGWGPLDLQAAALYRCVLLHQLSLDGFGTYPAKPDRATARRMGLVEYGEQYLAAGFAHERYEDALGRDYRGGP